MASINYGAREISVKIVYYGPGLSGKTTNLQVIHRKIPPEHKSDMVSLATEQDRTLFFDFLPLDLGTIKGFSTKFQLYTVPGQVYYNATRKLVLRGVDGVVFVADSAPDKTAENLESFQNLEDNLAEYHYKREEIPIIIQYNKRDLPNALSIDELQQQINKYNLPWTESVANRGIGVFDALKLMGKIVIDNLNRKYSRLSRGGAPRRPAQPVPSAQQYSPQQPMAIPRPQQGYGPGPSLYPQQQQPGAPYGGQQMPLPPPPMQQRQPVQPSEQYPYAPQQGSFQSPSPPREMPSTRPVEPHAPSSYGFVNFEPLPVQPNQVKPPMAPPQRPTAYQMPIQPTAAEAASMEPANFDPKPAGAMQQQQSVDTSQHDNAHSVSYLQKQRPARTQIDERDYNVYHVDSQETSFPRKSFSSDSLPVEDTDIRMQKKLNPQPEKQQKRFLSRLFNRENE
jgi:signal recognition particle receptor subunit beta